MIAATTLIDSLCVHGFVYIHMDYETTFCRIIFCYYFFSMACKENPWVFLYILGFLHKARCFRSETRKRSVLESVANQFVI